MLLKCEILLASISVLWGLTAICKDSMQEGILESQYNLEQVVMKHLIAECLVLHH